MIEIWVDVGDERLGRCEMVRAADGKAMRGKKLKAKQKNGKGPKKKNTIKDNVPHYYYYFTLFQPK